MKKAKIRLDDFELRIVIRAVNDLRTKLINENIDTNDVNEILLKLIKA